MWYVLGVWPTFEEYEIRTLGEVCFQHWKQWGKSYCLDTGNSEERGENFKRILEVPVFENNYEKIVFKKTVIWCFIQQKSV